MVYRVLSHTADTGLEATAPSLGSLIEALATGMFELMARGNEAPRATSVEVTVDAETVEDLVVDCLSELLYVAEARGVTLDGFHVSATGGLAATIRCRATPWEEAEITGPPIKAVTYHGLAAGKTDRQIGEILGVSPRTVHKHLQHIYDKLGVETRTAAVMRALGK